MTRGDVYAIAGEDEFGAFPGNGISALSSAVEPLALAIDGSGDLLIGQDGYVSGTFEGLVSLVARSSCSHACPFGLASMADGDIYTIAGGGANSPGDGGPATAADLVYPDALAWSSAGGLLIGEGQFNATVGRAQLIPAAACSTSCAFGLPSMTSGDIYTIAGGGANYPGDDGPASSAEVSAEGVAFDDSGDALVADNFNGRMRLVGGSSCSASCPFGLASTTTGYIYTLDAGQVQPDGLAVDSAGDLLIADPNENYLQLVAGSGCSESCPFGVASMTEGDIYTIAGTGTGG
jgi:ferredoxin